MMLCGNEPWRYQHLICFRSSQLCGSSGNTWQAHRRPKPWLITMATSCWTPVKSPTATTYRVDLSSVSSACWSSERIQTMPASISAGQPTKTSSMVMMWTSRKCECSAFLRGDEKFMLHWFSAAHWTCTNTLNWLCIDAHAMIVSKESNFDQWHMVNHRAPMCETDRQQRGCGFLLLLSEETGSSSYDSCSDLTFPASLLIWRQWKELNILVKRCTEFSPSSVPGQYVTAVEYEGSRFAWDSAMSAPASCMYATDGPIRLLHHVARGQCPGLLDIWSKAAPGLNWWWKAARWLVQLKVPPRPNSVLWRAF